MVRSRKSTTELYRAWNEAAMDLLDIVEFNKRQVDTEWPSRGTRIRTKCVETFSVWWKVGPHDRRQDQRFSSSTSMNRTEYTTTVYLEGRKQNCSGTRRTRTNSGRSGNDDKTSVPLTFTKILVDG